MNNLLGRRLSSRRPFWLLLSGLVCALLLSAAHGQQPASEQQPATEKDNPVENPQGTAPVAKAPPAKAPTPNKPADKPTGKQSSEVFRPSEEISEDLSVPFPVDI